ncbi:hypothetical protein ACFV3N_11700 [Streptomyces bauhiniae]|uniref:hypothetical protein n=1 Tax=Streptomyces bauhiniae TaxID=2340725 RepID=UPI00365B481D
MRTSILRGTTLALALVLSGASVAAGAIPAFAGTDPNPVVQDTTGWGQGPVTPLPGARSGLAASAFAPTISRSTVIERADTWVGQGIQYSWTDSYDGYRTDCSGYVSMAWNLGGSLTTDSFAGQGVTETIGKDDLKAGDALLNDSSGANGHIVLFHKWVDTAKSQYWGYEFTPSGVHHRIIDYPYYPGHGTFVPVRNKSVVDDVTKPASGKVFDRTRSTAGAWSTATKIDDNAAVTAISASGLKDGSMHVQSLVNGKVYDRTRSTSDSWSSATPIDENGSIKDIASAALPDGSLHVLTLVNGDIWDRTRSAAGAWSSAVKIDDNGSLTDLSAAALPDGTLHVQSLVNGTVWDRTRSAAGAWSSAVKIDDNGSIKGLAASGLKDGTLHVQSLVNGDIWDRTRSAAGAWSSAVKIDDNGGIKSLSSGSVSDGTMHVQAVVNGDVWDRKMSVAGAFSSATKIDDNGSIIASYATGLPDGTFHVGTIA